MALKHNSKTCKLDEAGDSLVRVAMTQLNLSARVYHRILKLARTIAELTGGKKIQSAHLADALPAHLHCNERSAVQVSQPAEVNAQHCVLSWGGLRSHLDGAKG